MKACTCSKCQTGRKALALLDDIANSTADMGCEDIDRLISARDLLATTLEMTLNRASNRYEVTTYEPDSQSHES